MKFCMKNSALGSLTHHSTKTTAVQRRPGVRTPAVPKILSLVSNAGSALHPCPDSGSEAFPAAAAAAKSTFKYDSFLRFSKFGFLFLFSNFHQFFLQYALQNIIIFPEIPFYGYAIIFLYFCLIFLGQEGEKQITIRKMAL